MMEKLEATILILVVLVGLGGMYYFFTASSGEATRMLVGCEGDFTLQLRLGGSRESADYRFKGIGGTVQILDIEETYDIIPAQISAGENIQVVTERVKKALRKHRGVEEGKEDFTIQTPESLLATLNNILMIVQGVLVGIAAISLRPA